VPEIIINDTVKFLELQSAQGLHTASEHMASSPTKKKRKKAISILVISNHNSFRGLFDKTASVFFKYEKYTDILAMEMGSQGTVSAHFRSLQLPKQVPGSKSTKKSVTCTQSDAHLFAMSAANALAMDAWNVLRTPRSKSHADR